MSSAVGTFIQGWWSGVWQLFGVEVPGFGLTFKQVYIGILVVSVSIAILYKIFGLGGSLSIGVHQIVKSRNYNRRTDAMNNRTSAFNSHNETQREFNNLYRDRSEILKRKYFQ